ncbi:MAG: hypothetical protein L3K11_06040 [Thermoplasmata archaeon]|nr:hypothetical protein [Thermoplasmata archaeon]
MRPLPWDCRRRGGVRQWAVLFAVVLLALPVLAGLPPSANRPVAPGSPAAAGHPLPAGFSTSPNGNFTLFTGGPTGAFYPGTLFRAEYSLTLLAAPPGAPPLQVWVPPPLLSFSTSLGAVHLFGPWANFTFGAPGSPSANQSAVFNVSAFTLTSGSFVAGNKTIFTSQLVSVMANLPYGAANLSLSWRWKIVQPDGGTSSSAWSPPAVIHPGYYVSVVSAGPSALGPLGSYAVCITGPLGGRTFSLHLEIAKPLDDFSKTNITAPASATSLCWSTSVPPGIPAGPLLAHVWAYDQVTTLLYVFKLTLLNSTPPSGGPLDWWAQGPHAANLAALVAGLGVIVVWGVVPVWRSKHPRP